MVYLLKMVIFHGYVKLPEGNWYHHIVALGAGNSVGAKAAKGAGVNFDGFAMASATTVACWGGSF